MLKLGIVTLEDFGHPFTWLGKERHASLLLLQPLFEAQHEDASVYDELVRRVLMPNGIWKQTAAQRLREVDSLVVEILQKTYSPGSHLTVTDLAASTGVTSVEFYQTLSAWFAVDFIASDLYRDVFVIASRRWHWAVILDHTGAALQYIIGRFVLPGQLAESWLYPVNRALKLFAKLVLLPRARVVFASGDECRQTPYFVPRSVGPYALRRLPFFSYGCVRLLRQKTSFRFETVDIMRPIPHRSHVVRAMNIVTPDYFDDAHARIAIRHCVQAIEPGGLLIMGQSKALGPSDVQATVYRIDWPEVQVLARLNGGCTMEKFVLQISDHKSYSPKC